MKRLTLTLTKEQKRFFMETGRAGGKARAEILSAARRKEIARKASKAAAETRSRKPR